MHPVGCMFKIIFHLVKISLRNDRLQRFEGFWRCLVLQLLQQLLLPLQELREGSNTDGMMFSSFNSLSGIKCANASAAANFISSVILDARTSIAPRKIPGNTATLLIWLGASERPVPAMRTPAAFISAYVASGLGLAIANTIASSAKFPKFLL